MTVVMGQAQTPTSRQRMVLSAIALLRERGYGGASFGEVLAHSGAPRGSIYHHFPDGKAQLMTEAVEVVAAAVEGLIARAGDDPLAAVDAFVAGWRAQLEDGDFRAGCPVVGVVVELPQDAPALQAAVAAAFARWGAAFAALLERRGVAADDARRLATLVVAGVEGAVILSRARRDVGPLLDVGAELRRAVGERLAAVG